MLSAFDADHVSLSVGELSRRTGIPKSSTIRLARHLLTWGALERRADGRFVIGLRLWQTGALSPRGHGLQQVAMPYMGDLAQVTRQHVLLAVRDGDEALLVERLSTHQAAFVLYIVGGRLPLHSTGVGLALLAFADADLQEEYLSRPLVHEPENVRVPPAALTSRQACASREGRARHQVAKTETIRTVAGRKPKTALTAGTTATPSVLRETPQYRTRRPVRSQSRR